MTGGPGDARAGTSITERLVAALTATWRAIQDRHANVPDVVLTLGSGTLGARRGEVTLGHFAAGRWHATEPTATGQADKADDGADGAAETDDGLAAAARSGTGGAVRGREGPAPRCP